MKHRAPGRTFRRKGAYQFWGDGDVGQPIMAAAAFRGGLFARREVSAFQPQVLIRWSNAEPPRKAAAAMIGCPTSPSTQRSSEIQERERIMEGWAFSIPRSGP